MQSIKEFDIYGFKKEHGSRGLSLLIQEFIRKAPEFEGDMELAKKLGQVMGDLEYALDHLNDRSRSVS